MEKKSLGLYGMDMEFEYRTYKYVGKDYGDYTSVNLGLIRNIIRFVRKKRNQKQKKYIFCNTYTEWENHVKQVVKKDIINSIDLLHWLYRKKNASIQLLEATKAVLIPIYIAMLSITNVVIGKFENYSYIFITLLYGMLAMIIAYFSAVYLRKAYEEVNFYNDFIKIAEKELLDR